MAYNNHIVITDVPEKAAVELMDLASFSNLRHFERNDSNGGISKVEHWDDVGICHDIYWFVDPTAPLDKVRGLSRLKSVQYAVTPKAIGTEEWYNGYNDVIVPLRNQYGASEVVLMRKYPLYYPSWQQLQIGISNSPTFQPVHVPLTTIGKPKISASILTCQHDWEEKLLFTGTYYKCKNCGEEKS